MTKWYLTFTVVAGNIGFGAFLISPLFIILDYIGDSA
jgi:hypothetical protein